VTAYAQAEAFNWNEFNGTWGGNDHYDEVNDLADGVFAASPRAWRLCSRGGWAWQPHLTYADSGAGAVTNNQPFAEILKGAGVTGTDAGSWEVVNVH
jgi:hypothetical protein